MCEEDYDIPAEILAELLYEPEKAWKRWNDVIFQKEPFWTVNKRANKNG